MATARVPFDDESERNVHEPVANAAHVITVTTTGPNSVGLVIGNNDTVAFQNLTTAVVGIKFICANGPVFNDVASINPNKTSPAQSPQITQITTDYEITYSNQPTQKPFSIEVGINTNTVAAPLSIPITGGNPPTSPDMSTVSVPQGGWIQFHYDQAYALTWNPSTAFSGPTNNDAMNPMYHASSGNQALNATYSMLSARNATGVSARDTTSGGSVKIRS